MRPNQKICAAALATLAAVGAAELRAGVLLRVDFNSNHLAEASSDTASWSQTEGDVATPLTVPPYPIDPDGDPGTGAGTGVDGTPAAIPFDPWFVGGSLDAPIGVVGDPPAQLFNSLSFRSGASSISIGNSVGVDPGFNNGPHFNDVRVSVTASTSNGVPEKISSIRRFGMPAVDSAAGSFNTGMLYRDFIYPTRSTADVFQTMDIKVEDGATDVLQPNTAYNVRLFCYDKFFEAGGNNTNDPNISNSTFHFTDLNSLGATSDSYIFNRLAGYANSARIFEGGGSTVDIENNDWSTLMTVFTDANGVLNIREGVQLGTGGAGGGAVLTVPVLNGIEVNNDVIQWTNTGGGAWGGTGNWTGGNVPNAKHVVANFFNTITGTATVSLDGSKTVGALNLSNANSYLIDANGNTLTLDSNRGPNSSVSANVRQGNHFVFGNVSVLKRMYSFVNENSSLVFVGDLTPTFSGGGTVLFEGAISLTKAGQGLLSIRTPSFPTVNVNQGTLRSTVGTTVTRALNIDANPVNNARLDVTNTPWIVDYAEGDPSPEATIRARLASGYAGGAWNGVGIVSTNAQTNANLAVGYSSQADLGVGTFGGIGIDASSVVFRLTRVGDANLDGITNIGDFALLTSNFNLPTAAWSKGDFNYDGATDIADFALLSSNFNQSAARSAVPEPAALGAIGMALLAGYRRPRR